MGRGTVECQRCEGWEQGRKALVVRCLAVVQAISGSISSMLTGNCLHGCGSYTVTTSGLCSSPPF